MLYSAVFAAAKLVPSIFSLSILHKINVIDSTSYTGMFWKRIASIVHNKEIFSLSSNNPKPALVYIVSPTDDIAFFRPYYSWEINIVKRLSEFFDVQLLFPSNLRDVKKALLSASAIKDIRHVIINAHGCETSIDLDTHEPITRKDLFDKAKDTFSPMSPEGTIYLHVCSTGKELLDGSLNFAQSLAKYAERVVVASSEDVGSDYTQINLRSQQLIEFHEFSLLGFSKRNITQVYSAGLKS